MYAIEPTRPGLWTITLPKPIELPLPLAFPNNVYLIADPQAPCLINAGHPSQFGALCKALEDIGHSPGDIARVVYTSWQIDSIGNANSFPRADHFALSDDMIQPRDLELHAIAPAREHLLAIGQEFIDYTAEREDNFDASLARQRLAALQQRYYPPSPRSLRLTPLRDGHVLRAGTRWLEVKAAPGPSRGHLVLLDDENSLLFTGDLSLSGKPRYILDAQPYLLTLEQLQNLEIELMLPNRGRPRDPAGATIRGALRYLNNFLSNAQQVMFHAPTLPAFVDLDMGYRHEDWRRTMLKIDAYRTLLDELLRAGHIEAAGEGLARRYGVDVEDPREPLRPEPSPLS